MELRTFHHHILRGFMLLSLISNCYARFVVEKNSLTITSPEKIKGTHDSAIGNFGIPQYGGSMAGAVVYPKENQKACKNFDDFGISFNSKPGSLPTFVLVDRGGVSVSGVLMFCLVLGLLVSPSHQVPPTLIPVGLEYVICFSTCVAKGSSPADCIIECMPKAVMETHHSNSSTLCELSCVTSLCSKLSTGEKPAAKEVAGCVHSCIARCATKN